MTCSICYVNICFYVFLDKAAKPSNNNSVNFVEPPAADKEDEITRNRRLFMEKQMGKK